MRHIHSSIPLVLASLCASICLVFFVILGANASEQETVALKTDASGKIGAVKYYDQSGKEVSPDYSKARLTALHFWATWCVPCIDELPQVDDAQDIFGAKLHVVPVALDGKNVEKVKKFFTDHKIEHLPVYLDHSNKLPQSLGLKALPGTLFIDSKGNIVGRAEGPLDWQQEDVAGFLKAKLK